MAVMVEQRSFRPFKSSEEYLYAMKEDLAEWLNNLYPDLYINVNNFMDRLDTGVALCEHANNVRRYAEEYVNRRQAAGKINVHSIASSTLRLSQVRSFPGAKPGTFFARDNVSNFIAWCRHGLGVFECLLFETDDLILRKNEKHVILCLLEVARRGAKLGMPAPMLVHLEREIDREIAADKRRLRFGGCQDYYEETSDVESDLSDGDDCVEYGPIPQIVTNDLKSLDEMVRDEVEKCQCPTQFPMIRVSEGKYRIGDTKVLIFVRILRSHVMVRVGGGWDTLSHYLDKHDPCRCRSAHRAALSSRITGVKSGGAALELSHAQVHYDRSPPRTRRSSTSSNSSNGGSSYAPPPSNTNSKSNLRSSGSLSLNLSNVERRSRSPTPRLRKSQTLTSEYQRPGRSRSPSTPNTSEQARSRSRTPCRKKKNEKKDQSFVVMNKELAMHFNEDGSIVSRSRSPSAGRRSRHSSQSSCRTAGELSKQMSDELMSRTESFKNKHNSERVGRAEDQSNVESKHRVSDNFRTSNQYNLLNSPLAEEIGRCLTSCSSEREGVDTRSTTRVSDNFINSNQCIVSSAHLLEKNHRQSTSPSRDRGGVDTSPTCKISCNFEPSQYYPTTMQQTRKVKSKERSGVDTTSVSKVSDNFVKSERSRKSSASVNDLDLITKKEQNDSGSEVSDEGYKSLGMVTTPPANAHQSNESPLLGSPSRITRPPRSRSAGGQDSPSPQQSPFRRNAKVNQSARHSPTHITSKPNPSAARNYNTWNSGKGAPKRRPVISEDTFCRQVAKIMQEYAAMVPSPRKDTKPDARISTRIPAPVPLPRT